MNDTTYSISDTIASLLPHAINYAENWNWSVFPAPVGKKKSHKSERYSGTPWGATRDADQIRQDFTKWPDANIGIPTGADNGVFVLDVDTIDGHGVDGFASLEKLEAEHGKLPDTLMAKSPSGSIHYFFKHPGFDVRNSESEIGSGIDIRGDGGMVIVMPSRKQDGSRYEWVNQLAFVEAPQWIREWSGLKTREATKAAAGTVREAPKGRRPAPGTTPARALASACEKIAAASERTRNGVLNTQAGFAGRWVANGEIAADVAEYDLLLACGECGLLTDDGEEQCKATIRSGFSHGAKDPAQTLHEMFAPAIALLNGTFVPPAPPLAPLPVGSPLPQGWHWTDDGKATPLAPIANPLPFTLFDDCATSAPKVWLHKGVMALGENSSWYGAPGSLKSALLTDIGVHVAAGLDWRGHRSKLQCGVVYFAFERADQAKRRLAAYKRRDGYQGLPIAIVAKLVNLLDPGCVDLIVSIVERVAAEFDVPVGLIMLDTWSKGIAAGGGNENDAKDQNLAAAHLRLVHEQLRVHIAGVGHTGKDETRGERGSNAREGDVDVAVQVTGDAVKTATVAKANDQPEGELVSFTGEVVHLGVDEDGDAITAFILSKTPAVKEAKGGKKLTDREMNAMRALENVIREKGVGGKVRAEDWRERLHREGVIKDDDTNPRATYSRIYDGLARKVCVHALDGWVSIRPAQSLKPLVGLTPPGGLGL